MSLKTPPRNRQLLLTKHSSINLALVAGHKPAEKRPKVLFLMSEVLL